MLFEIFLGVTMFTLVVLTLVVIILIARAYLVQSGSVNILINGDPHKAITVPIGGKLVAVLANQKIFGSSA